MEKLFIKVFQYIIFEEIHINIDNKNSPTLFIGILYYSTIIYEDSALGFRLGKKRALYMMDESALSMMMDQCN